MKGLSGKAAVVTGGATLIGEAVVNVLRQRGIRVAVFDIDETGSTKSVAQNPGATACLRVDITDETRVETALDQVGSRFGGGSIVNFTSISAKVAQTGRWLYPVSKAALVQVTRNLACDIRARARASSKQNATRQKHRTVWSFSMKRNTSGYRPWHQSALAALCSAAWFAAPHAQAQSSVTLYGILDAGVQYLSNADGRHSAVNLQSYGVLPSQIGLTGTEDLGGGLQAIFRLEQGINLNDGTAIVPGYAFFRGAYVGLSGGFGTVTVGRQFSVLFDRTLFYDPLLYAAYSGQGVLVPLSANFIDNSVKFKTPDYGGFSAEALAATGGVAGNSLAGRVLEIGAQYSGNGFGISAALHQAHGTVATGDDTSGQQQTIGTLAAHWDIDTLSLYGGGELQTGSLAPSKTVAWGGARYQINPFVRLAGGVYQTFSHTPSVGHPTLFIASGTYNLSKCTVAYVNLGYSRNSSQSSQPVYEYETTPLDGASQFGGMVGMYHTF